MKEITTGVAFLVSSIYGTGYAMNIPPATLALTQAGQAVQEVTVKNQATTTETRSFRDSKEVESYVREEYAGTPVLIDIARCESEFRQFKEDGNVIRGRVNREDIGVMQINESYHGESANKLGLDIYTAEGNVAFARYLYDQYGSKPWSASSLCWSDSHEIANKQILTKR